MLEADDGWVVFPKPIKPVVYWFSSVVAQPRARWLFKATQFFKARTTTLSAGLITTEKLRNWQRICTEQTRFIGRHFHQNLCNGHPWLAAIQWRMRMSLPTSDPTTRLDGQRHHFCIISVPEHRFEQVWAYLTCNYTLADANQWMTCYRILMADDTAVRH